MKTGLLCFLSLALFFVTYSREVTEEEMIWLKSREDLVDMANSAIENLKEQSPSHIYDDIRMIKILQQRKTLAGENRSVYMKLIISSMFFEDHNAEQMLSVLIMESEKDHSLRFFFDELPAMRPSYVKKMEEKWKVNEAIVSENADFVN